jgi:integrase
LRLSDVQNLEWNNVDEEVLDFRQKKTKGYEYLPLSQTALQLLRNSHTNILNLNNGKIFKLPTGQVIGHHLNNWSKKAEIKKHITFHSSRHTFATLTLTYGADLFTVSKLLGHTDIRHTQIYAKVVNESKLRAVNSLPELQVI